MAQAGSCAGLCCLCQAPALTDADAPLAISRCPFLLCVRGTFGLVTPNGSEQSAWLTDASKLRDYGLDGDRC